MRKKIQLYLIILTLNAGVSLAQNNVNAQTVEVESFVNDENGQPISGVKVIANDSNVFAYTNSKGYYKIQVRKGTNLSFEAKGYESLFVSLDNAKVGTVMSKSRSKFAATDNVKIAFREVKKGELSNTITVINTSDFSKIDNSQSVSELILGRVSGMGTTSSIRNIGNALIVIDGVPRYENIYNVNINVEEIEQVAILKDINAVALYGSQARNGVIIISTKRGDVKNKKVNIMAQHKIATTKALPDYLNSADYMTLYNEARRNDGLVPLYSEYEISKYKEGKNIYRYPDVDFYSHDYLSSIKNYSKVVTEFTGGNENSKFYTSLGWNNNGSLIDLGQKSNNNRLNIRSNVDFKISDYIKSSIDINGIYSFSNYPNGNYFKSASELKPNAYSPYIPINSLKKYSDNLNLILKGRKNDLDGQYLYGGNNENKTNPIADAYIGGRNSDISRVMQFSNSINVDMSRITKGLNFKSNLNFDFFNSFTQSISNSYSVYKPDWVGDSIVTLIQYGVDSRPGTQSVNNPDFTRKLGLVLQLNYNRVFNDLHSVSSTLLGFTNYAKVSGNLHPDKYNHIGFQAGYNYNSKYYFDFSSSIVSSAKLPTTTKLAFSPTVSFSWLISNEEFLKNNVLINDLRLNISAGVLNSDLGLDGFYNYNEIYDISGGYTWADGAWTNSGISSLRGSNNQLGYEQKREVNIGMEIWLMNNSLSFDMNYFYSQISNMYSSLSNFYPVFYDDFMPVSNFGINAYSGLEFGVSYLKKIGKVNIDLGITGMFWDSKILKSNELYSEEYLYRKGKSVDNQFGLEAIGLFENDDDINNHAFQSYGSVKPGDIKYKDQNGDRVINNDDFVEIGRSTPPFSFGINFKLSYMNFTLFANGTGNFGSTSFMNNSYYRPDGDSKYSVYASKRWTPETKETAKYPRLSSLSNVNNSQTSTFWQYSADVFTLNRMQLNYELPINSMNSLGLKNLSVFINGSSLLSISKYKNIKELNIGVEPQYRYFSIGINSEF